jgi:hypothetical protein
MASAAAGRLISCGAPVAGQRIATLPTAPKTVPCASTVSRGAKAYASSAVCGSGAGATTAGGPGVPSGANRCSSAFPAAP